MCNNASECIAETLCLENDLKQGENSTMKFTASNNAAISKKFEGDQCTEKNSSFKQVCEFPIRFCRRGSKDLLTWINSLTSSKKSPLEIAQKFYDHMQSSLLLVLVSIVMAAISIEAFISLVLLLKVIFEPGFLFLFISFVGVGFIGLSILTDKQKNKPKKKIKSKEI